MMIASGVSEDEEEEVWINGVESDRNVDLEAGAGIRMGIWFQVTDVNP